MGRANIIATTERLTRDILIREILGNKQDTFIQRYKTARILNELKIVVLRNKVPENAAIYCFMKLHEDKVIGENLQFSEAFIIKQQLIAKYISEYKANIETTQRKLRNRVS